MRDDPKVVPIGRWNPGRHHAQIVLRVKDVIGSMAEVNRITTDLGLNFKQVVGHSAGSKGYAVLNAFVEFSDPALTEEKIVAELMKSPYVLRARAAKGREGGVVDTLTFPVKWGGRRVVLLHQEGLADLFQDVQSSFGSGGDVILFKGGLVYGKRFMEYLGRTVGREVLVRNAEYATQLLAASGIGVPEYVGTSRGPGAMTLRLHRCFECEGKRSVKPMCSFIRGALVGGTEAISGIEFDCVETACAAMGKEYCEFELTPKNTAEAQVPEQRVQKARVAPQSLITR